MIKVLHILPGGEYFGGTERYLYNYYKHMDHASIHFDFLFGITNSMKMVENDSTLKDSAFISLNAIRGDRNSIKSWIKYYKKLKNYVDHHNYDIIEVQTASLLVLLFSVFALKGSKSVKIAHAHSIVSEPQNWLQKIVYVYGKRYIRNHYDYLFSCSDCAAKVIFGESSVSLSKYKKITNAIDTEAYEYNPRVREKTRKKYGVKQGTVIVGHIARLSVEKNQAFLIKVFSRIHEMIPDSQLWIIGDGELRGELENLAEKLDISGSVFFYGQQSDITAFLQAMDLFMITSFKEGLCISAVESQAAGLPTFVSDGVPEECRITENLYRISLDESIEKWTETIISVFDSAKTREDGLKYGILMKEKYDLKSAGKSLEKYYLIKSVHNE